MLAPVHDAVLIEAPIERIESDVALMQEIMRRASRIVLNADAAGTHELRTDKNIIEYPGRYRDPRGDAIWDQVMCLVTRHRSQPGGRLRSHPMSSSTDRMRHHRARRADGKIMLLVEVDETAVVDMLVMAGLLDRNNDDREALTTAVTKFLEAAILELTL